MWRLIVPILPSLVLLAVPLAVNAQGAQQDVSITANVPSTCRLGGTSTPPDLNMTIPITAAGNVNTATQSFNVFNVFCTRPTSVLATSMNGGVRSATVPGPSFTNIINYVARVRYGFATSNLNTATNPAASGPESGNAAPTFLPWFGTLRIDVTPTASPLPLAGGNDYADVLRITLTPE
jgi:hypothetical protein